MVGRKGDGGEKKCAKKIFRYHKKKNAFFRNGPFFPPLRCKTLIPLETSSQGVTLKYGLGGREEEAAWFLADDDDNDDY